MLGRQLRPHGMNPVQDFLFQRPGQLQIQRLKKRKLGLKDEIARLESRLIPDRTA